MYVPLYQAGPGGRDGVSSGRAAITSDKWYVQILAHWSLLNAREASGTYHDVFVVGIARRTNGRTNERTNGQGKKKRRRRRRSFEGMIGGERTKEMIHGESKHR